MIKVDNMRNKMWIIDDKKEGHTEIWTRIIGFKVQGANHYTIRPFLLFIVESPIYCLIIEKMLSSLFNYTIELLNLYN